MNLIGWLGNTLRRRQIRHHVGADELGLYAIGNPFANLGVAYDVSDQRDHEKQRQRKELHAPTPVDVRLTLRRFLERTMHGRLHNAGTLPGPSHTAAHAASL